MKFYAFHDELIPVFAADEQNGYGRFLYIIQYAPGAYAKFKFREWVRAQSLNRSCHGYRVMR
jgi:hypothetical protein